MRLTSCRWLQKKVFIGHTAGFLDKCMIRLFVLVVVLRFFPGWSRCIVLQTYSTCFLTTNPPLSCLTGLGTVVNSVHCKGNTLGSDRTATAYGLISKPMAQSELNASSDFHTERKGLAWREGSGVKSNRCSCRAPTCWLKTMCKASPRAPDTSSGLVGTGIYRRNTHEHEKKDGGREGGRNIKIVEMTFSYCPVLSKMVTAYGYRVPCPLLSQRHE